MQSFQILFKPALMAASAKAIIFLFLPTRTFSNFIQFSVKEGFCFYGIGLILQVR